MESHNVRISWGQWGALLCTAAAARIGVAFFLLGEMDLQADALSYSQAAHGVLDDFPGDKAYFWPPGLPFYLAAVYGVFGDSLTAARLAMLALGLATTAMVAFLALEAFGKPKVALAAGWIAALYPPAVLIAGQTFTQELTSLALLIFTWSALRFVHRPSILLGGLAGLSLAVGILTRPSMLSFLPLVTLAGLAWALWPVRSGRSKEWGKVIVSLGFIYVCVAGVTLPVMAHNAAYGQGWSLSTNNEMNFLMGNNPYTHHYKTSHLAQRRFDQMNPDAAAYFARFLDPGGTREAMREAAIRYVLEHPGITLWRTLSRVRAFWGFDYLMSRSIQNASGGDLAVMLLYLCFEAGGYFLLMLGVISGLLLALRAGEVWPVVVLIGFVLAYQAPYTLAFSSGAYHFPVMGLLMPIAALNFSASWKTLPVHRAGERAVFWTATCLLVLIQIEYGYHAAALVAW